MSAYRRHSFVEDRGTAIAKEADAVCYLFADAVQLEEAGKEQMEELCKELVEELRSGVIRGLGEGHNGFSGYCGGFEYIKAAVPYALDKGVTPIR